MNTEEQEKEYHCQVCHIKHRSREDSRIFHAHLAWNPKAVIKVLPDRYSASLWERFRE